MALANDQNTLLAGFAFRWELFDRRSTISGISDLQRELLQQHANRLIIIKGGFDKATAEVLQSFGVEKEFLDAYQQGKVYRPRIVRDYGVKTFCWKFPRLVPSGFLKIGLFTVTLLNASLWVGIRTVILFIEMPVETEHQTISEVAAPSQPTNLEDELLTLQAVERQPVEVQLGQVIYERWRDLLENEQMKYVLHYGTYWDMTVAVEQNLEQARHMTKITTQLRYAKEEDWKDLVLGLERRAAITSLVLP